MEAKVRESAATEVSDVLSRLRLPKVVKDHLRNHEIWSRWPEIVGAELSRVTSPVELKGRVLAVHVAHQAWAQQLHFLKPSILGKIRSVCPTSSIKDLQFRVGRIRNEEVSPKMPLTFKSEAILSERMELALRAVEDSRLRESIRRAMEAAARRI